MPEPASFFSPVTNLWQRHRHSPKAIPIIIIVITVLLLLLFRALQPEPPVKVKEEKSWIVQTTVLQNGPKAPQLELFGKVESPYTTTITSSIEADVLSLDTREGATVKKGQLLIQLDEFDVKLSVEQRQSDVAELVALIKSETNRHKSNLASLKLEKSLVALAEKKLQREEKTSKSNLTSQSSLDSQKQALQNQKLALKARQLNVNDHPARLAQLEARLEQKRAQLELAEKDLQRASILAPFDGLVLSTSVSPGERVRPGEQILQIYSVNNVELRAQLPQRHIDEVKSSLAQGIPLTGIIQTESGTINASLHRVSGSLDNTGSGVDALFEVSAADTRRLVIGEVLDIIVTLPDVNNVYRVPVSSIYGTDRIYRVKDKRLELVKVDKLGMQLDHGAAYLLIRSPKLQAGDEIITTQLPHAISGLKVDIRNQANDE